MRAMADCPFIDPNLIDKLAEVYFSGEYDFCHLIGEFPSVRHNNVHIRLLREGME